MTKNPFKPERFAFGFLLTSGIYAIRCKINGRMYIGRSTFIGGRIMDHLSMLFDDKHHNNDLALDFEIYGPDDFEVFVLEECDNPKDVKLMKEWEWIAKYIMQGQDLYNRESHQMRREYEAKGWISRIQQGSLKFFARREGDVVEIDRPNF